MVLGGKMRLETEGHQQEDQGLHLEKEAVRAQAGAPRQYGGFDKGA